MGDRIAFLQEGVVKLALPDGTALITLTDSSTWFAGFDWSPDGRWLALATPQGHNVISFIRLLEVETGLTLRLPFTIDRAEPSWQP